MTGSGPLLCRMPCGALTALVFLAVLNACAVPPGRVEPVADSGIDIEGIIIRNGLSLVVNDVMVTVPATGSFAGCGTILPRTGCSTSFPLRDYRKNDIKVTWSEHGEQHQTEPFTVNLPSDARAGDIYWVEVEIYAPGLAGARLVRR